MGWVGERNRPPEHRLVTSDLEECGLLLEAANIAYKGLKEFRDPNSAKRLLSGYRASAKFISTAHRRWLRVGIPDKPFLPGISPRNAFWFCIEKVSTWIQTRRIPVSLHTKPCMYANTIILSALNTWRTESGPYFGNITCRGCPIPLRSMLFPSLATSRYLGL